ncbi:Vacuolar protein-sorting-associated protein 24 [Coemansia sp. RSA 2050]|nr:Vacuolar protein-sorting-associated protein 24 [Coemansia sp. RSA 2050]KAJ2732231.1 Vacuolar protein-sorting-associated protein 24 [Coemansia sp. BCRC 34962]
MFAALFAKPPTPDQMVRKWQSGIQAQKRELNRQLRGIETEESKAKLKIKQLAKKNDSSSCQILAKGLVRSHKQKNRIHASMAQLNSIAMELQRQLALLKVAGSLKKSTLVMRSVNQLVRVPQLQVTLMEMSKEMMKAGVIEEMTEDMLDALDDDELEDEANDEVMKVLAEITNGQMGFSVPATLLKGKEAEASVVDDQESEDELDLKDMQARLSALRS